VKKYIVHYYSGDVCIGIENWLNHMQSSGLTLVSFSDTKYIFTMEEVESWPEGFYAEPE